MSSLLRGEGAMPVSAAATDLVPSQVKGSERNSALNRMDSQLVRVISNPRSLELFRRKAEIFRTF